MRPLFAFLGLAFGIVLGYCREWQLLLIAALLAVFFLYLSYKKKALCPFFLFLLLGFGLGLLHFTYAEGKRVLTGIVYKTSENSFLLWSPFLRVYVVSKGHSYQVGDVISVSGYLKKTVFTTYESRFDYQRYLHYLGVDYSLSYGEITDKFLFPLRLRQMELNFLSHFNEETQPILDSLLFARRDYENETIVALQEMHVLYLFSASGLLLQGCCHLVQWFWKKLCKKEKTADLLTLLFALCFLPLCFRKIGILRVVLGYLLRYISNYHLKKKLDAPGITGISGILTLSLFRYAVFQTGFLLGYGIAIFMMLWGHLLERISNKKAKKLAGLGLIRSFLLPLSASQGNFHLLSMLFALLLAPFAYLLYALAFLSFLTFPFPALLDPLTHAFCVYAKALQTVDVSFSLPGWDAIWIVAYYLCLFLTLALFDIGVPMLKKALPLTFVASYLLSCLPLINAISCQVSFLNVGQGDCILIRDGFTTVLLDTGGNTGFNLAKESVYPYLLKQRIYSLDCLIASHQDADHIGEKEDLMELIEVKNYVENAEDFPLKVGNLTFENLNTYGGDEENELSLVLKLDFMGQKWMFMGDAPVEIEQQILDSGADVDVDILKVGHHGSKTSTSKAWLEATSPKEAVISVGAKNSYGHPSSEVLARLEEEGCKIRRTDKEGTITYTSFR